MLEERHLLLSLYNALALSCEGVRRQPRNLAVQYTARLPPRLRPRQLQGRVRLRRVRPTSREEVGEENTSCDGQGKISPNTKQERRRPAYCGPNNRDDSQEPRLRARHKE